MHPDEGLPDELLALLGTLDHPVPAISASAIADKASARRRRPRPVFRWAAAAALILGVGGVALAAPGSPFRRWVEELAGHPAAPPPQVPTPAPGGRESAGVAVAPGESFAIVLRPGAVDGVARVSFGQGPEIIVRAPSGGAGFTTEPDRLTIELRSAGDTVTVEIPRTAPRVELFLEDERLLAAASGRVATTLRPDSIGRYTFALPARHAR